MVARLEQEDVYEPADLHDLRQTSRFTAVFSELYQLRINRELDSEVVAGWAVPAPTPAAPSTPPRSPSAPQEEEATPSPPPPPAKPAVAGARGAARRSLFTADEPAPSGAALDPTLAALSIQALVRGRLARRPQAMRYVYFAPADTVRFVDPIGGRHVHPRPTKLQCRVFYAARWERGNGKLGRGTPATHTHPLVEAA
eukprot:7014658-Prymnesium_polylepis.1